MSVSNLFKVAASSVLFASLATASFAGGHHAANYKGDYKNEAPCPMPPSLMDGIYVGVQGGYDAYRVRQSLTSVIGTSSTVNSATGWVGGLNFGYGQNINEWLYLGGELLANYDGSSTRTMSFNDNDGDLFLNKVQPKGTVGLSFLPGLRLNNASLGYLRLGYDWTRFYASATAADAGGASTTANKTTTQGGWDFGLGLETLVSKNWSVRTEYNHVWYNSFSLSLPGGSQSFDPSNNQFLVTAQYHFA